MSAGPEGRDRSGSRRSTLTDRVGDRFHAGVRWGVRGRIAASVAGVVVALAGALGAWAVQAEARTAFDEALSRAVALLETLSVPCTVALATDDVEVMDGYLGHLAEARTSELRLEWIAVADHTGTVMAESGPLDPATYNAVTGWLQEHLHSDRTHWRRVGGPDAAALQLTLPAVAGLRWGTLLAHFDLGELDRRVATAQAAVAGAVVLLALILLLLITVAVDRAVLRRLEALGHTAEAIMNGDLAARAKVDRADELGRLALTFNAMAEELHAEQRSLEQRVASRTSELQEVNARLERAVDDLARLARTDELTGLSNRRAFRERMDFELRRSRRAGYPFALVTLDIDHFKQVNDTWGHPSGDRVLVEVSNVLKYQLRSTDIVGRIGGEEFAVLVLDAGRDAATQVAEKILDRVRESTFRDAEGSPLGRSITISAGIALHPEHGEDIDELMSRADEALYAAKAAGRDRVVVWRQGLA